MMRFFPARMLIPNMPPFTQAARQAVRADVKHGQGHPTSHGVTRICFILTVAWMSAFRPLLAAESSAGPIQPVSPEVALRVNHWAFQPIAPVSPPVIPTAAMPGTNPIDAFILTRLREKGLSFSPRADRATLIRRVTFDLLGLPPTPSEVDAFVADSSPDAYGKLIDRLLASRHYGERWGRHWLDVARFAETDGYEYDAIRPNAWRYRQYVIDAFNADKPYDRFIREQIAGDELWPDDPEARIATGFNLLGPDMVDSSDQIQRRHNMLNDMTDTASLAFLGLTVGCARCHDHKFDPISQHDYYGLQAFFTSAVFAKDQPIPTPAEQAEYAAAKNRLSENSAYRALTELDARAAERVGRHKLARLSPEAQSAHDTPAAQRTAEQGNLVLETDEMLKVTEKESISAMTEQDRRQRKELLEAVKSLPRLPTLPSALAMCDGRTPVKTFILHRGEYSQPREQVQAGFPAVFNAPGLPSSATRRADLAEWLVSPAHPLTARVMVNRIWQHHFGHGLVATPSDFGTRGEKPTHPELLDWLAAQFISRGWSIKQMHRLMLASETYQQISEVSDSDEHGVGVDPDNHLYWRMNRPRLEGEVIRDTLLAISGQLNEDFGGPGVYPPIPADVFKGANWDAAKDPRQFNRRSIYIFARRNLRFPFLEVFDAPDSNLSCPVREQSTSAPQSLMLLNSDEVMTAANAAANRLRLEAGTTDEQIALLYRLALSRRPTPSELELAREFLRQSPLSELCRVMFNLNEFVYVN